MPIFPAGYLNSHKDDADDAIDNREWTVLSVFNNIRMKIIASQTEKSDTESWTEKTKRLF